MNFYKFLIIFLLSIFSFANILYALDNKIVLKIENNIVTSLDIKNEIKYLKALNPKIKDLNDKEIFKVSKNSIIREKIKEIEILKNVKTIELEKKYLEQLIQSRYKSLGLETRDQFVEYLKQQNTKIETISKKITIEAVWNQLIYSKFSYKIKISEDNLKKKILADKEKNMSKEFLLNELVFNIGEGSNLEDKYQTIQKSIKDIGFENTASTYSISDTAKSGGSLGWIEENSLNAKIKKQIINLKLNEYTKPITLPGGFLVLQLMDMKKTKRKVDVNTELNKAINFETNRQLNQFSNIYYNKIKREMTIDVY